jgi:hypothetical protein
VTPPRDHHATIFVAPGLAAPIEAVRRHWDPVMAAQVAAHVTLVYPREAPELDLLDARLRAAACTHAPFRLGLGEVACFDRPSTAVYVQVHDLDGGFRALRADVLAPPFHGDKVEPHVTLIHPRTSARGREFWDASGRPQTMTGEFTATELTITAFDGTRWTVIARFPLGR